MLKNVLRKTMPWCGVALLGGCSLPGQGPSHVDLTLGGAGGKAGHEYVLISMDPGVVRQLGVPPVERLSDDFSRNLSGKSGAVLGIGDRLVAKIWEASADGLFSTAERKQTSIEMVVDESGEIYMPYIGALAAAGKTVKSLRNDIAVGLKGKAAEPQVQVALVANNSNHVVVVGDVANAGRFVIPLGGIRLLDVLAQAGGADAPVFETEVSLVRGDDHGTIRLDEVLNHSENNVWLEPGDALHVLRRPCSYSAFGAVTSKNHLEFSAEQVSLAEALAESGGLNDNLADAGGVFLFRFELPERLEHAGKALPAAVFEDGVATIYHLDFNQPGAFFMARSFMMRDKDIIYVSNAPASEFYKFIRIFVQPLLNTYRTADLLSN